MKKFNKIETVINEMRFADGMDVAGYQSVLFRVLNFRVRPFSNWYSHPILHSISALNF